MPSINDLNTVKQFLNALSWKKIAQLTVFIIVVTFAWLLFQSRQAVVNFVTQDLTHIDTVVRVKPELSESTIKLIDSTVEKSDLIVGIIIVSVDFQKNTRSAVYGKSDEETLLQTVVRVLRLPNEVPLFNSDPINNKRMTDVINGEFICSKYSETINAQLYPETTKYIETVCISGIPPYYGAFNGIVGIFAKRVPTPEEVDQLRVISRNISSIVYDKDSTK